MIGAIHVEEARLEQMRSLVKDYLEGHPSGTVVFGGKPRGFVPGTKRKLNDKRLADILAEHGLTKDDLYEGETKTEFKVS